MELLELEAPELTDAELLTVTGGCAQHVTQPVRRRRHRHHHHRYDRGYGYGYDSYDYDDDDDDGAVIIVR